MSEPTPVIEPVEIPRAVVLDSVLRDVAEFCIEAAATRCREACALTSDPFLIALSSFVEFCGQRYEAAVELAEQAIALAGQAAGRNAEALMLARAASGLAAAGWPLAISGAEGDPLSDALADISSLDTVEPDTRAFVLYLLAEASLASARLDLAAEFVARSGELPVAFLGQIRPHPFLTPMRLMRMRLLGFQGRIDEALALGETAVRDAEGSRVHLLADATMCLLLGNASQRSRTRQIADRLERELPAPDDYLSSGCYLLVAFGLVAIGDIARSAQFVLLAGRTPGLESLTIVDRALGMELLVAAALAADDLSAAQAWRVRAMPLAKHPISAPIYQRLASRVELLAGDAPVAVALAEEAIAGAVAGGRMVEAAEAEIVLARARIAISQRGAAGAALETMVTRAVSSGHYAARASAARELRAIGRRMRPAAGSGWDGLSVREREVALLIAEGFSTAAIAAELRLSEHTVKAHSSRVLAAFGASSRFMVVASLMATLPPKYPSEPQPALTPRQAAVASLVSRGLSNERIAGELGVSVKTVEKHVGDILRRWGIASRVSIARLAFVGVDSLAKE